MAMAFLVVVVSVMDRYIVSILLQQIKLDLQLSDTDLGLLVGPAFVVVHVLFQLPLARVADRSIRRNMISVAMFLWSLFTIAAGFARSFPQLLLARMGVGVTEAASSPALASMLSDYFPPERRGRAMSMFTMGGTAGVGAGMLLGGVIGQEYGWRTALIVAGVPGVLLAILLHLTVREPQRAAHDDPTTATPAEPVGRVVRTLFGKPTFRWLVIGASLSMVTSMGRGSWEPVFLMRVYGMDQASAGITYFLIGPLPAILGAFLGGAAADRLGKRDARWYMWLPAIATLTTFPLMTAFLLWPVVDGAYAIPFGFSIVGSVIGAAASPATIAMGQSLAKPTMRATAHALWTMAANLVGMGLGPLIAGALSDGLGPSYGDESIRYALVVVSAVAVPAAIALHLGSRTIRRDLENV
jgi:MFS family permease